MPKSKAKKMAPKQHEYTIQLTEEALAKAIKLGVMEGTQDMRDTLNSMHDTLRGPAPTRSGGLVAKVQELEEAKTEQDLRIARIVGVKTVLRIIAGLLTSGLVVGIAKAFIIK